MSTERLASAAGGGAVAILARPEVSRNSVILRLEHRRLPAAGDGARELEALEPAVERAPAEAEHLGRGFLVAAGAHQRALDVIPFDVDQKIRRRSLGRRRGGRRWRRGNRGPRW